MTEAILEAGPQLGLGVHAGGIRKKFATPPVKIACLACRGSRTRCDGGHPCASCQTKDRECVYTASKRGGARVRRKPKLEPDAVQIPVPMPPEPYQEPISLQKYIDPGAGLKQLGDFYVDSDLIFDSLFINEVTNYLPDASLGALETQPELPLPIPMVRTYQTDAAILEAYYVFIHPYFPILPPPTHTPVDNPIPRLQTQPGDFEANFEPSSPIALAISAILALIPCPNDMHHSSHDSLLFRRGYAQFLSQAALETIEADSEIPESSTAPQGVLESEVPPSPTRPPFHLGLPQELETIVALDILSVYEYAQRGNLKKMQSRAGQALVAAMSMSLHCNKDEDMFAEARRRVWWMTYICACQGSIVSNTPPTFAPFASSFTTKFPTIGSDPECFPFFVQAQQAILSATQFVIDLNKIVQENGDMSRITRRMQELETMIEPLINRAEPWSTKPLPGLLMDSSEAIIGYSLRCMSRIKLNSARIKVHRYCAFFDLPIFTGKHCDLKSKSSVVQCSQFPITASPTNTSGITTPSPLPASIQGSSSSPQSDYSCSCSMPLSPVPASAFPFTNAMSTRICLRSALNIAADFDKMPFPNPMGALVNGATAMTTSGNRAFFLSPTSATVAPRTMPSFACCAMQCAYALLMVHEKTMAAGGYQFAYPDGGPMGNLLVTVQQGLRSILTTLENYGTAFEALGGMRDQIRNAIEPTLALQQ